jgi:hypothetical protein
MACWTRHRGAQAVSPSIIHHSPSANIHRHNIAIMAQPPLSLALSPQSQSPLSSSLQSSSAAASTATISSPVVPAPPAPNRGLGPGGRKPGAKVWDAAAITFLLEEVERVLPRGHQEWEKVVSNYNARTQEGADFDRLKNKFNNMAKAKKPTGENTMRKHIENAKRIHALIVARTEGRVADGDGERCV